MPGLARPKQGARPLGVAGAAAMAEPQSRPAPAAPAAISDAGVSFYTSPEPPFRKQRGNPGPPGEGASARGWGGDGWRGWKTPGSPPWPAVSLAGRQASRAPPHTPRCKVGPKASPSALKAQRREDTPRTPAGVGGGAGAAGRAEKSLLSPGGGPPGRLLAPQSARY